MHHLLAEEKLCLDKLNRPLKALRISITDKCNRKCSYCLPENYALNRPFIKEDDYLSIPEITSIARSFVKLGVDKIRITGGEPLLRPGVVEIVEDLSATAGVRDLSLTTNGLLLKRFARSLKSAGLGRVTVGIDISVDYSNILTGLDEAKRVGFKNTKINVVIQRGLKQESLLKLTKYCRDNELILRFIEFMDAGNCNNWAPEEVISAESIIHWISYHFPLVASDSNYYGEVASRYKYKDGKGEIGIIASVTKPFCRDCTRARISADGKFYNCLFASSGFDLKKALHSGLEGEALEETLSSLWAGRIDRYSEERQLFRNSGIKLKKVEMFQIGG
ncbi:MAG: GTP 3',8-cyclase MoaA [Candidatus Omnitrophica bacterium]|nr:GTP 3',8-cyclase MoaA [Candidatus Omnitrophota bacterium]